LTFNFELSFWDNLAIRSLS